MIDRAARNNLAERLHQLAAGVITNDAFEDRARRTKDPVIGEIEWRLAWPAYDDMRKHKLAGDFALSDGARSDFARAVLFLKSDLAYEWKNLLGIRAYLNSLFRFWPPGRTAPLRPTQGDLRYWPFFRRSDYRAALKDHPYLKGPSDL